MLVEAYGYLFFYCGLGLILTATDQLCVSKPACINKFSNQKKKNVVIKRKRTSIQTRKEYSNLKTEFSS